jgi:hypothetical protein
MMDADVLLILMSFSMVTGSLGQSRQKKTNLGGDWAEKTTHRGKK